MAQASRFANGVTALDKEHKLRADSLKRIIMRRFFHHRMAAVGMALMGFVLVFVIGGALFYTEEYANNPSLTGRLLAPTFDLDLVFGPDESGAGRYLFGTDETGRDLFSRAIYGGQISLAIGFSAVAISVTLGTLVGLVSGYFGGIIDSVLMRIVEALLTIPPLVLLLMLNQTFVEHSTSTVNFLGRELSITVFAIVGIIGLTSWMGLSRIVRSLVLSLKEQEFILAARMVGAGTPRIIFIHILPNCVAPIMVAATLGIGNAILTETALSFLGFGVTPPTATWGNIISPARQNVEDWWWMWVFPGFFVTVVSLSINFIGDGLRDALDPRAIN